MIHDLIKNIIGVTKLETATPGELWNAANDVLAADPFDLVLYMERVWEATVRPWSGPSPSARQQLWQTGRFKQNPKLTSPIDPWDHLIYAYVLESTHVVDILKRVVLGYRNGESLGIPTEQTMRWVDATEVLMFGAANPLAAWLSTSTLRADPAAVRRNAYWRMFGSEVAPSGDGGQAVPFERAAVANTGFTKLFEDLLHELWKAISNERNFIGPNQADDDRIYRISEQLRYILTSRRQGGLLRREELAAVTALGWAELTVAIDSPVVRDLKATGSSAAERLRSIGDRVGLKPHGKSAAFFSMAKEIALLLRTIEAGVVRNAREAWVLYALSPPPGSTTQPIGVETRRVITEWAAASDKNLKDASRPTDIRPPQLVAVA